MTVWNVENFSDEDINAIVERLRAQGSDDNDCEAKAAVGKLNKDVWNTVSAFANTDGGVILLGIDETSGFIPAQGFDPNKIIDSVDNGLGDKAPRVEPVPTFQVRRFTFEGAPIVALGIASMSEETQKAKRMPCFVVDQGITKGSYKRLDDKNKHLTAHEIYQLQHRYESDFSDQQIVEDAAIEDLDMPLVNSVIERLHASQSRLLNGDNSALAVLRKLNSLNRAGEVVFSGLMCFGVYPQQFFPQLFIDVAKHPGQQKSADPEVRFDHRKVCEGHIKDQIEDAIGATLSLLNTRYVERGRTVEQEPEIPEVVLREAITNAVMHRDYGPVSISEQVAIDIFSDRVEIRNPGGLWGDRTLDNLDDGRSVPRNQFIAKTLSYVPARDKGTIAENQGSGIRRMQAAMKQHGLPQPQFKIEIGAFTVVLHRHGLLNPEAQRWLEKLGIGDLSPERAQVMLLAREYREVTPQLIRSVLGIDSDEAREELGELVSEGLLTEHQRGPERYGLSADVLGLTPVQVGILGALEVDVEHNIHQLMDKTGYSASTIRYGLRGLIDSGRVQPTAPPTSRSRAYVLNPQP